MIDQDYAELLNRSPPSGDVLEWTFSTRTLASLLATLLVGTPALCFALYYGLEGEEDPRGGASLRVSGRFVWLCCCHALGLIEIAFVWLCCYHALGLTESRGRVSMLYCVMLSMFVELL